MKKPVIFFSTVCASGVVLLASLSYLGPRDELMPALDNFSYNAITGNTSFGMLVKFSDSGGIGEVISRGHSEEYNLDYFSVRVNQAFWGCTNGQILNVYDDERKTIVSASNQVVELAPTNLARFVFAASTNVYEIYHMEYDLYDWNHETHLFPILTNTPFFYLKYGTRSWWYEDYQGGHLTTQLTNVLRTVRTHRNWTNYYEVCRDGAALLSDRVQEDSFYDLRDLIIHGSDEQLNFMFNDSMFPTNNFPFLEAQIQKRQQKQGQKNP